MACKLLMMQGDQYGLGFRIKIKGTYIDIDRVSTIQFVVGSLVKNYLDDGSGQVTYDNENNRFYFPISQNESFNMSGPQDVQVRIKFTDSKIIGKKYGTIELEFSETEVEI